MNILIDATVLSAFSVDHAARVTGLSRSRLTRWDKLGFFSPEYLDENDRGNPYARIYSYFDLVGLRTLAVLADDHKVPLSELRKAATELAKQSSKPWAEIPLAVLKKKVVFDLKNEPRNVTDGQAVLKHIPLPSIASQVSKRAASLRKRTNDQIGQIDRNRYTARNADVMAGTRIPVSAIKEFIEAGYDNQSIVYEYPTLLVKDVKAVRAMIKEAA